MRQLLYPRLMEKFRFLPVEAELAKLPPEVLREAAEKLAELRFATEEGVWVLENLSFSVRRDGFVWVVGPPGSGKPCFCGFCCGRYGPMVGKSSFWAATSFD